MGDKNTDVESHLIDDSGVHKNIKTAQITFFVAICRVMTIIMVILGVAALIAANM